MNDETLERIRQVVAAIPRGQVRSYGQVAATAELRSARLVGRVLAEDGHDLPWHRVVRADGTFAPHLASAQAARLRAEGVDVRGGRVVERPPRPDEDDGLAEARRARSPRRRRPHPRR